MDVPFLPVDAFDEIYAIDGGSKDGTVEYLESRGVVVHRQSKRGLNAAYIDAAERSTCDAVVVFFQKGTLDPACVSKFRPLFSEGYELVVASRNIQGGRNEEDSQFFRPRKWGVFALSYFASLVWRREGHRIRDVLHGVKGFSVAAFRDMDILDYGLSIDIEMVIRSYRLRIARTEFPVEEELRGSGTTHFRLWPTAKKIATYTSSGISEKRRNARIGKFKALRRQVGIESRPL